MLDNLLTTVFGRSKGNRPSGNTPGRNSQGSTSSSGPSSMTGPFTSPIAQMPQPPSLPYPVAPYPATAQSANSFYPSLPFDQPPMSPKSNPQKPYPGGPVDHHSPLDSIPFEAQLTLTKSINLKTIDSLFQEMRQAIEKVDRVDAYLRSRESDYDFKTEQNLMYH